MIKIPQIQGVVLKFSLFTLFNSSYFILLLKNLNVSNANTAELTGDTGEANVTFL